MCSDGPLIRSSYLSKQDAFASQLRNRYRVTSEGNFRVTFVGLAFLTKQQWESNQQWFSWPNNIGRFTQHEFHQPNNGRKQPARHQQQCLFNQPGNVVFKNCCSMKKTGDFNHSYTFGLCGWFSPTHEIHRRHRNQSITTTHKHGIFGCNLNW